MTYEYAIREDRLGIAEEWINEMAKEGWRLKFFQAEPMGEDGLIYWVSVMEREQPVDPDMVSQLDKAHQDLDAMEREIAALKQTIEHKNKVLDSQQNQIEQLTKQIEREANRPVERPTYQLLDLAYNSRWPKKISDY